MSGERKTALITSHNIATLGGSQESIRNILGFSADWLVVTPHESPDIEDAVYTRHSIKIPFSIQSIPTPSEVRKVNARLTDMDPQHILLFDPRLYEGTIFANMPRHLRERTAALWVDYVNRPADTLKDFPIKKLLRPPYRAVLNRVQGTIAKQVAVNLTLSQGVTESLVKIGANPSTIRIIPPQLGNKVSPRERLKSQGRARDEFLDEDELGVLVVSRISPEKGLDWVPNLYRQLRRERRYLHPDAYFKKVKLAFVGGVTGSNAPLLAGMLSSINQGSKSTRSNHGADSIEFEYLGSRSMDELEYLYNAFDALFMPSPMEGFGRVTVESMMGGMTVIGRTQSESTTDIISAAPYSIGMLSDSPEDAAAVVLNIMNRPDFLQELQGNALRWSNNHYSLKRAEQALWESLEG